jgi:hypothetical protein
MAKFSATQKGDFNMSTAAATASSSIAYAVAKGIIVVGNAIKIGALVIAALMLLYGMSSSGFGAGIMIPLGILVGVAGFAAGILVSAQGQINAICH